MSRRRSLEPLRPAAIGLRWINAGARPRVVIRIGKERRPWRHPATNRSSRGLSTGSSDPWASGAVSCRRPGAQADRRRVSRRHAGSPHPRPRPVLAGGRREGAQPRADAEKPRSRPRRRHQFPQAPAGRPGAAPGALAPARNREAALVLAAFLARFWSAPARLGQPFPIDRRALAGHRDLALTEARVRGAIRRWRRSGISSGRPGAGPALPADGRRPPRRPLAFHFGAEFQACSRPPTERPRRGPQKAQDGRRPLPASSAADSLERHGCDLWRTLAKRSRDPDQARRLLALAEIYDGARERRCGPDRRRHAPDRPRLGAALQRTGPEGLINGKAPGSLPS